METSRRPRHHFVIPKRSIVSESRLGKILLAIQEGVTTPSVVVGPIIPADLKGELLDGFVGLEIIVNDNRIEELLVTLEPILKRFGILMDALETTMRSPAFATKEPTSKLTNIDHTVHIDQEYSLVLTGFIPYDAHDDLCKEFEQKTGHTLTQHVADEESPTYIYASTVTTKYEEATDVWVTLCHRFGGFATSSTHYTKGDQYLHQGIVFGEHLKFDMFPPTTEMSHEHGVEELNISIATDMEHTKYAEDCLANVCERIAGLVPAEILKHLEYNFTNDGNVTVELGMTNSVHSSSVVSRIYIALVRKGHKYKVTINDKVVFDKKI